MINIFISIPFNLKYLLADAAGILDLKLNTKHNLRRQNIDVSPADMKSDVLLQDC